MFYIVFYVRPFACPCKSIAVPTSTSTSTPVYSRVYVYVYVHQRTLPRLRLRPPGRDRARTLVEQTKNTRPEHAAKPQALARGETLGKGF